MVRSAHFGGRIRPNCIHVDGDFSAEIRPAPADGVTEVLESEVLVGADIDYGLLPHVALRLDVRDQVTTAPTYDFLSSTTIGPSPAPRTTSLTPPAWLYASGSERLPTLVQGAAMPDNQHQVPRTRSRTLRHMSFMSAGKCPHSRKLSKTRNRIAKIPTSVSVLAPRKVK